MIYIDSCVVIYALEDDGERGELVRRQLAETGDEIVAISSLVVMECLTRPLREENYVLRDRYLRALERFYRLPLDEEQFLRAAELRARYGLKTPDALHLAAAQTHGCEAFWTNDTRLSRAAVGLSLTVFPTRE